jgi:GntR family transcriptional repressor for pyruvate dehydrogenase complex
MSDRLVTARLKRSRTIPSLIIDRIQGLIADGRLAPGDKLPAEGELAASLGVARSSVREAIRTLEGIGVVQVRQGKGIYLACNCADVLSRSVGWLLNLNDVTFEDLAEARLIMECAAARLAALRASDEDIEGLQRLCDALTYDDPEEMISRGVEFHLALSRVAGNRVVSHMATAMRDVLYTHMTRLPRSVEALRQSQLEHHLITERIRARDPEGAEALMCDHLKNVKDLYRHKTG